MLFQENTGACAPQTRDGITAKWFMCAAERVNNPYLAAAAWDNNDVNQRWVLHRMHDASVTTQATCSAPDVISIVGSFHYCPWQQLPDTDRPLCGAQQTSRDHTAPHLSCTRLYSQETHLVTTATLTPSQLGRQNRQACFSGVSLTAYQCTLILLSSFLAHAPMSVINHGLNLSHLGVNSGRDLPKPLSHPRQVS